MKNTLVVNLFGGAGIGKSVMRADLFSALKKKGVRAEESVEWIKNCVYEHRDVVLDVQSYIFSKQYMQQYKLVQSDQIDVVITDSPVLLSAIYDPEQDENLKQYVIKKFNQFNNLNVLLIRSTQYQTEGRYQTEEESIEIDKQIKRLLDDNFIPYIEVQIGDKAEEDIIEAIISRLIVNKIYEEQNN